MRASAASTTRCVGTKEATTQAPSSRVGSSPPRARSTRCSSFRSSARSAGRLGSPPAPESRRSESGSSGRSDPPPRSPCNHRPPRFARAAMPGSVSLCRPWIRGQTSLSPARAKAKAANARSRGEPDSRHSRSRSLARGRVDPGMPSIASHRTATARDWSSAQVIVGLSARARPHWSALCSQSSTRRRTISTAHRQASGPPRCSYSSPGTSTLIAPGPRVGQTTRWRSDAVHRHSSEASSVRRFIRSSPVRTQILISRDCPPKLRTQTSPTNSTTSPPCHSNAADREAASRCRPGCRSTRMAGRLATTAAELSVRSPANHHQASA